MSKQRASFFGLTSKVVTLLSMMKWQGKQDDRDEGNQKYGSPIFMPKRKKRKGYQKKSEISSFNKNR